MTQTRSDRDATHIICHQCNIRGLQTMSHMHALTHTYAHTRAGGDGFVYHSTDHFSLCNVRRGAFGRSL